MTNHKNKSPAKVLLLFGDLIAYLYGIGPALIAWGLPLFALSYCHYHWATLIFFPAAVIALFIFTCFIFQRLLPKMKPGLYKPGASSQIIVWHLNNALANALENAGLKSTIYSFHLTRWLYWRAMGMKVPFGIICSTLVTFREYPLITIAKGTAFSAYNHVSCHTFEGERLLLGPISIGERSFIGMNTVIGPRTKIGNDCFVGAGNILLFDTLKDGAKIDHFEYQHGNPKRYKKD